jgi:RND family efflux transporter MFP subunit
MLRIPLLFLIAVTALLTACEQPAPLIVTLPVAGDLETLTVEAATVTRETSFDGRLEAINRSTVSAQTSGRITQLPFDIGDYVEAGELIVAITDDEQQAQVERAQAAVAEAQAQRRQTVAQLKRVQEIYDQRLVAKAELDAAVSSRDAAVARFNAAEATLTQARQALQYTRIHAPFPGIVVDKFVELGETVSIGTPLMAGLSLTQLRAVVDVPQQHMAAVRDPGQARVILPDGRSIAASALRLPPNADPETGTFRVRADLPADDYGVFPGSLVKVAFVSGEDQAMMLPENALARRGEVTGAYVLNEQNQLQFRYLRVGSQTTDGRVPVLSGLVAGEQVAVDAVAAAQRFRATES